MKTLYLIVKSPTSVMEEDLKVFNDKKTRDDYFDSQLKSLKQAGHHIQFHNGKFYDVKRRTFRESNYTLYKDEIQTVD